MKQHDLFPTLVLQDHNAIDGNGEILNSLINRQEEFWKEEPLSALIDTSPNQGVIDFSDEEFQSVCEVALSTGKKYLQYSGYDPEMGLRISDMWANMYTGENGITTHNHPNSYLSGVFYLTEDNNPIAFFDPNAQVKFQTLPKITDYEQFAKRPNRWEVMPNKGDLLLFPSYLYHSVGHATATKKSINIAFNLSITGPVGDINLHTYNENI